MKITYITLDPLKYPRIKKIATTLRKDPNIQFQVMIPKIRLVWRGSKLKRILSAIINYTTIILQIFFLRSDIFWVANCPDILVFPLILMRKRYILEYRSPWAIEVEHEFGGGPWVRYTAFFERIALKHARIITLTTRKLYSKVSFYGKPILVIPNYPLKSFGKLTVPREEFRRRLGYNKSNKVVLYVGKLTHVEGVDLLPRIVKNVLKKKDESVFWIIGDGPLYRLLKRLTEKFPKRVRLFGWQPHENIPNFILASDVCIAPRHKSQYSGFYNEEGLQKFSEYMFFKKPIVACGVAKSSEYLLVNEDKMADGILQAFRSEDSVPQSKRRTWEDYSEKTIFELLKLITYEGFDYT